MTDQYNKDKDFQYKKPKVESPEYLKLRKEYEDVVKRLNNVEGRLVASISDQRTTRKNMMAQQEHMKALNTNLDRTNSELRRLKQIVEAMLREDEGH